MKIVIRDTRLRPTVSTPPRGSLGDKTIQGDKSKTDLNNILARYAGNLAELKAWQGTLEYGDQSTTTDLVEAFDTLKEAQQILEDGNFESIEEAINKLSITEPPLEIFTNETNENQPPEK